MPAWVWRDVRFFFSGAGVRSRFTLLSRDRWQAHQSTRSGDAVVNANVVEWCMSSPGSVRALPESA